MHNIGIVGRKRSGKDTAANYLVDHHGYVRHGLADPLKEAALALDPIVHVERVTPYVNQVSRLQDVVALHGWEAAKDSIPEVRRILQRLGDEAGRQVHGDMTWVEQLMKRVEVANKRGVSVVVPDVRYQNEAWYLFQMGFTIVRISRPGYCDPTPGEHMSERVENLRVDREIVNDGSVFDLYDDLNHILAPAPVV